MAVLDLPDGPHTRVWRKTLEILQGDEVLSRAVRTWVVPDGSTDPKEMTSATPLIRLEPGIGPMSWYDPGAQAGDLIIRIRFVIQSRDAADRMNLWAAFIGALYPYGQRVRQDEIQQALRDAGAEDTGQYTFSMPPGDPDPRADQDGIQACDGQMRIGVVWTFSP